VEAGVKINAVAGTSVGALNGALICMGDVEKAEKIHKDNAPLSTFETDDFFEAALKRSEQFYKKEVKK
jgi:predicted acylesterase/phospholipase RssA